MNTHFLRHFAIVVSMVISTVALNICSVQAQQHDSRWSFGGFYRAKASYLLTVQNSLCGGDCDYLFSMLPLGELGLTAQYAIQPTLGVHIEASWNTHGYSYRGTFSQNTVTGERTIPQYSVAGRYLLIAPSVLLQEQDTTGFAWRWTAGLGLGIPLGLTVTRTDIAADGTVLSDRYLYPAARLLEPLLDVRIGALIPLAWKGLHLTAALNYNVGNFFKTGDSYGSSVERANALGVALGVQYLMPLKGR